MQTVISALLYLAANAVGLLIAKLVIPGFQIDFLSFLLVVVVFSVILAVLTPLIRKFSEKKATPLMGGIALVSIAVCLFLTNLIMAGMDMGGVTNWIAASVLVWLGSVIATLALPRLIGQTGKS
ncbi:phage holin family protein [Palleronia sp. KMU-117]|uniref:phage holin family protein n=1 Tax=Palleronia sp. KMU-117 TaxID=3434108 RepID=UPI003D739C82